MCTYLCAMPSVALHYILGYIIISYVAYYFPQC